MNVLAVFSGKMNDPGVEGGEHEIMVNCHT